MEAPPLPNKPDVSTLPQDTLDFAHRMFDAARKADSDPESTAALLQAIGAGLPVNLTNDKGNTLLMLSAYAGHTSLTTALLQRHADPNRLNDMGQSIVAGAVFKGYDGIVKELMANGADPRLGKPNAIETAVMFGRQDLMAVLGAREGDVGDDVPRPLSQWSMNANKSSFTLHTSIFLPANGYYNIHDVEVVEFDSG